MKRAASIVLCCAMGSASCSQGEHAEPPNVLIVCVDALRPDHLGVYGAPAGVSPNIDHLATEAVVFDRAFSVASWTKPSVASLLTGLYPSQHRVLRASRSGVDVLPDDVPTLAERMAGAGYRTAAFVDNDHLRRRTSHLDRGFQTFVEEVEGAAPLTNRFLDWLEEADERPFFAYLHILDPHWPYTPEGRFGERALEPRERLRIAEWGLRTAHWWLLRERVNRGRARLDAEDLATLEKLYDGEISATDAVLGRMLRLLRQDGVLDHTLLVLTADHGEGFLEHGRLDHGWGLYEELLHVPLIVRYPGGTNGGRRIPTLVQTVDVAPTVLEAAGVLEPGGIAGESLSSFLSPSNSAAPRIATAEDYYGHSRAFSVRTGSHKYIRAENGESDAHATVPEVPIDLAVGDRVQLEGILLGGGMVAAQIKRVGNEDRDHEVAGPIEFIDPARRVLRLIGYEIRVDDRSQLRDEEGRFTFDDLRVQQWVRAEGIVRDGRMRARKIARIFEGWAKELELEGIVEAFGPNENDDAWIELCGRRAVVDPRVVWKNFDSRRKSLRRVAQTRSQPASVEELYDLSSDPTEQRNIAAEVPDLLAGFQAELAGFLKTHRSAAASAAPRASLDDETRDRLRLLGYLEEDPP